jgi:hypothetical protein
MHSMGGRLAADRELEHWRTEGWVVLDGLVGIEEIDAAKSDLWQLYPTPEEYFGDPDSVKVQVFHSGNPLLRRVKTAGPADQFLGLRQFPFPGSGAMNHLQGRSRPRQSSRLSVNRRLERPPPLCHDPSVMPRGITDDHGARVAFG